MQRLILLYLLLSSGTLFAQDEEREPKFILGLSYGTTFPLGDFRDSDISNPDAGFAKNGQKFDIFTAIPFKDKIKITGVFRYQSFSTEVEDLINQFREENPGVEFTGSSEDWQTFYFLVGMAYRIKISKKFGFSPRFGLGPLFVKSPGINIDNTGGGITNNFNRSSETGVGLGYEIGIGLRNDLGKHFSLMPTFTFSGGIVTIKDVITSIDNLAVTSDYSPTIFSFNLGLSLAYRFY